MKKAPILIIFFTISCSVFTGCPFGNYWVASNSETHTELIGTNMIGIVGEPSDEPYIEIIYSVADESNPGFNRTESIMISPPYIFKNEGVYMTYEYIEWYNRRGPYRYDKMLVRDFNEGGAEHIRIINHSTEKQVEFFLADKPVIAFDDIYQPSITYNNIPVYWLLLNQEKSIEEVNDLYRAEFSRSETIKLIYYDIHRLIDLAEGNVLGMQTYKNTIFYGIIEPETSLNGNPKLWILAIGSFYEYFEAGSL